MNRAEQRQLANVRVQVDQLRRESRISRTPLDATTKNFVDFILENETSDPLLQKNEDPGCGCLPSMSIFGGNK